jgi:AcrR family transcriptional regulator
MSRITADRRDAFHASRRSQILDAALRCWVDRGFTRTPVEAIAREAGLGKGTLYLYFQSKDEMLRGVFEQYSLLPDVAELTNVLRDASPASAIPQIVDVLWMRLRERAPLVGVLLRELAGRPADARRFVEAVMVPATALFAGWLDRFVSDGVLRPLDTTVAARALIGMLLVFVLSQEVFGGAQIQPISDAAITETVSSLFLRGALAPALPPS